MSASAQSFAGRVPSDLPGTALWPGAYASIGDLLADAFVQFKSETALIEVRRKTEGGRWTYLDAWRDTGPLGALFEAHDLGAGSRVAILMSNQPRWLIGASAAFLRGLTIMPLDYKLSGDEQAALLGHGNPAALIVEYGLWRRLPPIDVPLVIISEAPEGADLGGALRWEDLEGETFTRIAQSREDVACLVYSSGTGGTPKGCLLTHNNYLSQWESLARLYPMVPGDRFFSILPTNHAIDFMTGFIGPFACGGTVVHQRTLRPEFLRSTLRDYAITHMALVPRLLEALREGIENRLTDGPDWKKSAFSALTQVNASLTWKKPWPALSRRLLKPIHEAFGGHMKLMFAGGAFVPPDLSQFFYDLGLPVVVGYGLTEACTVVTVNDLKPFRADSVGPPVFGVDVRIAMPDREGVGEVQIKGPTVFKGYLNEPELTAASFTDDGWLKTGDLGHLDGAGHLHLVGRSKNMIVTAGGKNVYPEDVEIGFRSITSDEYAVTAANFVWPKRTMSEEALMLVVRAEDGLSEGLWREILACNRRLPEHKRVQSVLVWEEEFPVTASLKLKRGVLAERIRAQLEPGAAHPLSEDHRPWSTAAP